MTPLALADTGSHIEGPIFWILIGLGVLVIVGMAIAPYLARRTGPADQCQGFTVDCVHANGYSHPTRRDRSGWSLCPRGSHFRITPKDVEHP